MLNSITLDHLSQIHQIDKYSLYREYLQIKFLKNFYQSPLQKTYFKGGTALRLIFNSPRFSEDLDFTTFISPQQLQKTLASTLKTLRKEFPSLTLKPLPTPHGYSVKLYLFGDFSSQPLTIKLDFSFRENVLEPLTSPLTTRLPVFGTNLVDHLSPKELLAEKIRAIIHRRKGRDIFDLWFLLHNHTPIDPQLINKKLNFYGEQWSPQQLIHAIRSFSPKQIDQDLRKFLPREDRKIIPHLPRLVLQFNGLRLH